MILETIIRVHVPSAIIELQRDIRRPGSTSMDMVVDTESENPVHLKFGNRKQYDEFLLTLVKAGDQFYEMRHPEEVKITDDEKGAIPG